MSLDRPGSVHRRLVMRGDLPRGVQLRANGLAYVSDAAGIRSSSATDLDRFAAVDPALRADVFEDGDECPESHLL